MITKSIFQRVLVCNNTFMICLKEYNLMETEKTEYISDFVFPPFPGCLRLGLSWFNWWVSFAPEFQCCYFCESSCLFYLSFNFYFYVSKIMHL